MGEAYWSNKKRVLGMIKRDAKNLEKASKELRDDKEVVMAAVQKDGMALWYVSERLRRDRDVVMAAVSSQQDRYLLALQFAPKKFQDDKDIVMAAVKKWPNAFAYASKRLQDDEDVIMAVVKNSDSYSIGNLDYASKRLQNDKKFAIAIIRENIKAFEYISKRFKNDKDVVMEAVKKDGWALEYASDKLKDDKEVVMAAIKETTPSILEFVSERLQTDEDVVGVFVRSLLNTENRLAYRHGVEVLCDYAENDELANVLLTIRNIIPLPLDDSRNCFYKAPPKAMGEVLKDKETVLRLIGWNPMCAHWLSKKMLEDTEIKAAIAEALSDQEQWVVESVSSLYDK